MSDRDDKLRELAVRGATEGERRAALKKLLEGRPVPARLLADLAPLPTIKREYFPSFDDPSDPRCYCCGRREGEMSSWAWYAQLCMKLLPLEQQRIVCCDCERDPEMRKRPCSGCGEPRPIQFSLGDVEWCHDCIPDPWPGDGGGGGGDDRPPRPQLPGPPRELARIGTRARAGSRRS